MNDIELATMLSNVYDLLTLEAEHRQYSLKKTTVQKLISIRNAVNDEVTQILCSFDRATNSFGISIQDYVIDSAFVDLKTIFAIVDSVCIDATTDGIINIEALIRNACDRRE